MIPEEESMDIMTHLNTVWFQNLHQRGGTVDGEGVAGVEGVTHPQCQSYH